MTALLTDLPAIPHVHGCRVADYPHEVVSNAKPCVLKGYAATWPAVRAAQQGQQAIQSYLLAHYNGSPLHVMHAAAEHRGRLFYNEDLSGFTFTRAQAPLQQILTQLQQQSNSPQPETLYVGSTRIDAVMPRFRDDNDIPPLSSQAFASIWLGNQSRVAAHFDAPDNIAVVVAGRRRFVLFPPEQVVNLYIGPLDFTPAGQSASLVDFHQPDFKRYPRFADALANAQVAVLEPGDALFIPATWWHHIEALDPFNVLVNYWWRQVDDAVGIPGDALLHAMLAIKTLPDAQRQAWRHLFDHYVFDPAPLDHIPTDKLGVLDSSNPLMLRQLRAMLLNKLNR